MELLYVWIENYKNIHHQGFNFSPKYRFEFDYEKKELSTVDKSKDCIEGFFDPDPNGDGCNIVNVTGIIGENGSGKSTFVKGVNNIIDFLLNNSKEKIFQTKFILILSGKDKKSINAYHNFEVNPPFSQKEDSIINILINLKEIILTNIDSIFLSNVFDGRTLDYKHIKDISTNKLAIRTRYKNFTNFYNDEFKRQIEFANKSEYIELKLLPFQIPNKVNFIFQNTNILSGIGTKERVIYKKI
jgi:energy-coupling factor transporter ATP-binding protein EcfA2